MKCLIAKGVKKYFGKDDSLVKAVDGINLEIESERFTAIVGTSGDCVIIVTDAIDVRNSMIPGQIYNYSCLA